MLMVLPLRPLASTPRRLWLPTAGAYWHEAAGGDAREEARFSVMINGRGVCIAVLHGRRFLTGGTAAIRPRAPTLVGEGRPPDIIGDGRSCYEASTVHPPPFGHGGVRARDRSAVA